MTEDEVSIDLTTAQYSDIIAHTPSWHACVIGPPPWGTRSPMKLTLSGIIRETREEAELVVDHRIRQVCEAWRREYDEDEWTVQHLVAQNCN